MKFNVQQLAGIIIIIAAYAGMFLCIIGSIIQIMHPSETESLITKLTGVGKYLILIGVALTIGLSFIIENIPMPHINIIPKIPEFIIEILGFLAISAIVISLFLHAGENVKIYGNVYMIIWRRWKHRALWIGVFLGTMMCWCIFNNSI